MSNRGSKNQLTDKRDLKGYVVLLKSGQYDLALNHGPCLAGRDWGYDWVSRATVFSTRTEAKLVSETVSRDEQKKRIRVVPLKEIAVIIRDVNDAYKVYNRVVPKYMAESISRRVRKMEDLATKYEEDAEEFHKVAARIRKQVEILERQK